MHFGFGGFGMILFWIALIAATILLVRALAGSSGRSEAVSRSPLNLLKERYAAGEITRDTFEAMKRDLKER